MLNKICSKCLKEKLGSEFLVIKGRLPASYCVECYKKQKREYSQKNLVNENGHKRDWATRNKHKVAEARKKWRQENAGVLKAGKSNRKKHINQATPKWLTSFHYQCISAFYEIAHARSAGPVKYHVDHIIPIRGKNVCGLNVPWNLETLKAEENMKKGNKLLSHRARW